MIPNRIVLCVLALSIALASVSPAAAEGIAVYGGTGGFIPSQHADRFTVVREAPSPGDHALDGNVAEVTGSQVQVIFIGSSDDFSSETVAQIEQAVWDGKILVVSFPATGTFRDSLPFSGTGIDEGTEYLEAADPGTSLTRAVLDGLPTLFNATGPVHQRLSAREKAGTSTLLSYSTGEPALAYRQYGNGYVIGWTLEDPSVYLGTGDADTILSRLLVALLDTQAVPTPTSTPTPEPTTLAPTETTPPPTPEVTTPIPTATPTATVATTGTIIVNSNPMGATVFLDGLYQGKTPVKLTDVPAGYHSLKMTMDGRYDFDGSVTAVAGQTVTAFGSLPKEEGYPPSIGTTAPVTTTPAATGSENPLASPVVIGGIITAAIGALATVYTQKTKKP